MFSKWFQWVKMEVLCSLLAVGQQGMLPPIWVTQGRHGRDLSTPDTWGLHYENALWILAEKLPIFARNLSFVLFEKFLWDYVSSNFLIKGFFLFFSKENRKSCVRLDFLLHNENREYISTVIYYINTSNHKGQREYQDDSRRWLYYIEGDFYAEKSTSNWFLIGV